MLRSELLILLSVVNLLASICCQRSDASLGLIGDSADVIRPTSGGNVLAGGGSDVDNAFRWMINKSGGGDFVVLRATGTDAYNSYIFNLGSVNSVETLIINSRSLANDRDVERTIVNAEAVFIAGGNQANYVNFWKDTKVEDALNYLSNIKKVPIGGTSAGCAILGGTYYSALVGSLTSSEALNNPYDRYLTLGHNDFLTQPYLINVISDTHFNNPDRRGRLITFLARMNKDYGIVGRAIGIDESTAVVIDSNGIAKVFGDGFAFFLIQNGIDSSPEICQNGSSLDWYRHRQAIKVNKIQGNSVGNGQFNLNSWNDETNVGKSQYYYVNRGSLSIFQ